MGACINHPETEAVYQCQKYQLRYCRECITCRDPKLYCKFRSACLIWFALKKKSLE